MSACEFGSQRIYLNGGTFRCFILSIVEHIKLIAFVVLFPLLYMLEKHVSFFLQLNEIWMEKAEQLSGTTAAELQSKYEIMKHLMWAE